MLLLNTNEPAIESIDFFKLCLLFSEYLFGNKSVKNKYNNTKKTFRVYP